MMECKYDLDGIMQRGEFAFHYVNEVGYRVGLMSMCVDEGDWECRVFVKAHKTDSHRWRNPRKIWSFVLVGMLTPGRFTSRKDALAAGRLFLKWCREHKSEIQALLNTNKEVQG